MEKKRFSRIMSRMDTPSLISLAEIITKKYPTTLIKKPEKTLAMIKMREPVKNSLFYLGEVLVTEAVVEIDGVKGMAVCMGDDFDKVVAMAVLDCAENHRYPEMEVIEKTLLRHEKKQIRKIEKENGMMMNTMVSFNTMAGEN